MSISRTFSRNLILLVGALISGVGLSEVSIAQVGLDSVGMLLVGPVLTVALLPRSDWLKMAAGICLMGGTFGLARIAAEIGRYFLYESPLPRSGGQYAFGALLFTLYGAVWIGWRWRERNLKR